MSAQENILRSLASTSGVRFDGALQILDIITEMVADRIGANICITLYRTNGDSNFRLLAVEDTAGLATAELPAIEAFLNQFGERQELNDRYLEVNSIVESYPTVKEIMSRLNLVRAYSHLFETNNGDSAMIVSLMPSDERTGIVSARKVCQLAAQQFNVIFQFVELELRQIVITAFMKVILRLSAMSFEGLAVSDALDKIRLSSCELTGVREVELLSRESFPDAYHAALIRFEQELEVEHNLGIALNGDSANKCSVTSEVDETLVEMDSSIGAWRFDDSSYVVGLERGPKPQWILRFWPNQYTEFSDDEIHLLKLFGSYSVVAIANYSLLRNQRQVNDELRSAQDRLVEAESLAALGDMATGIAHDFNNLLGGIIGRVELMANRYDDSALLEELATITNLAEEGAERIKRLQEFAIAAKPANLEPFDIKSCFENYSMTKHAWSAVAVEKNISVSFVAPKQDSVMIAAKGDDIEILLDSLIKNAIEATAPRGSVKVSLSVSKQRVTISVSDAGRGIPASIKNKIFNPFFSTKSHKGAGLGLSVAHGIAVRHGGAIRAESGDSTIGSTFITNFPLIDAVPIEEQTIIQKRIERPLNIMVVDDDPQIREVLGDMLTLIDQVSDVFPDGHSALAAFEKGKYDLVITDLGMPGMSGLELTEELKKLDPEIPVAMVTGWGAQLNQTEMLDKGVFTVVAKPFYLKDVREVIATMPKTTI